MAARMAAIPVSGRNAATVRRACVLSGTGIRRKPVKIRRCNHNCKFADNGGAHPLS